MTRLQAAEAERDAMRKKLAFVSEHFRTADRAFDELREVLNPDG